MTRLASTPIKSHTYHHARRCSTSAPGFQAQRDSIASAVIFRPSSFFRLPSLFGQRQGISLGSAVVCLPITHEAGQRVDEIYFRNAGGELPPYLILVVE